MRIYKIRDFDEVKKEFEEKNPHIELLTYNGCNKICKFDDRIYGPFEGKYSRVFCGRKKHPKRSKDTKNETRRQTTYKKYGVYNISQLKETKEKVIKTNNKKFGCDFPLQNKEFKEKTKQTLLNKYGVDHISKTKDFIDKVKKTCLEKYGVEFPNQSKIVRDKTEKTNLKKYGFASPMQNQDIIDSKNKTILERYGVDNISKLQETKDKVKQRGIESGKIISFNGIAIVDIFRSKEFKVSYTSVINNFHLYGEEALEPSFYDEYVSRSRIAEKWLLQIEDNLGYTIDREFHISGTFFHADGFDSKTNTIYEFYGDFWHGNPNVFNLSDFNKKKKITYGELYENTMLREKILKDLGYNLIVIWEKDFISTI